MLERFAKFDAAVNMFDEVAAAASAAEAEAAVEEMTEEGQSFLMETVQLRKEAERSLDRLVWLALMHMTLFVRPMLGHCSQIIRIVVMIAKRRSVLSLTVHTVTVIQTNI